MAKKSKAIVGSGTIDWEGIKEEYFASSTMGIQTYLRDELQRGKIQYSNGNTHEQTKGRQAEKIKLREKAHEKSVKELEKSMVKEKVALMTLAREGYNINSKRILIALKEDETKQWAIKDARDKGASDEEIRLLEKCTLSLSDRVHLNRELRTILGIPNNPTTPQLPPPELEDPSRALLDLMDNEV